MRKFLIFNIYLRKIYILSGDSNKIPSSGFINNNKYALEQDSKQIFLASCV